MAKNKLTQAFERQGNLTYTENMAVTHASTMNPVLDFYFHAPSRQGQDNLQLFLDAYNADKNLALKALFYLRDVRQGKGQRKTFRDILQWLAKKDGKVFDQLVPYVPEYGRWDDLTRLVGFKVVQKFVAETLQNDLVSENGVTLLGKWMPSENASSSETKELAVRWAKILDLSPKQYRLALSDLRRRIQIVESQMSANEWDEIDYERIPSRAAKQYRKAFSKHDATRYGKFIEAAITGEKKINSSTLYPHEITSQIRNGRYDRTLDALWNALPNYFSDEPRNILVVVDTSSSMVGASSRISNNIYAMDVSVGLGIYCAERNTGPFQNYVLTFNSDSHLVEIKSKTLEQKVREVLKLPWGGSTNLQASFNSILQMADTFDIPQEDMPSDVLIISDMEFDRQCEDSTHMETIQRKFKRAGYDCPRLVFWNVCSRHNQVPATENERGALLVSGFSAETVGKVLNTKVTTPVEQMIEVLNSERYAFINEIA